MPDREEYVDGAEYLLKHEEDTHIEGQVSSQYSGTDVQVNMCNARILYGPINPATHPQGPQSFQINPNKTQGNKTKMKRNVVAALLLGEHGRLHCQLHGRHHSPHPRRPQVILIILTSLVTRQ